MSKPWIHEFHSNTPSFNWKYLPWIPYPREGRDFSVLPPEDEQLLVILDREIHGSRVFTATFKPRHEDEQRHNTPGDWEVAYPWPFEAVAGCNEYPEVVAWTRLNIPSSVLSSFPSLTCVHVTSWAIEHISSGVPVQFTGEILLPQGSRIYPDIMANAKMDINKPYLMVAFPGDPTNRGKEVPVRIRACRATDTRKMQEAKKWPAGDTTFLVKELSGKISPNLGPFCLSAEFYINPLDMMNNGIWMVNR